MEKGTLGFTGELYFIQEKQFCRGAECDESRKKTTGQLGGVKLTDRYDTVLKTSS